MKRLLIVTALAVLVSSCGKEADLCSYVNVFSGTDENGHCHPCACLPFGAIQCGPQTGNFAWEYCGGYQWRDTVIQGFSQTRINGTGSSELGDLLIMPFCGDAVREDYSSAFNKMTEEGEPGYYRCFLTDYDIEAELSCTPRVAIHRYSPNQEPVKLMVDLQSAQCESENGMHMRIVDCDVDFSQVCHIKGYTHSKAWNDRTIYYDIEFNRPYTVTAVLPLRDKREKIARRVLDFGDSMEPLIVKASISVESVDAASNNIRAELPGWDFNKVRTQAYANWNDHLNRIEAKGDDWDLRVFYTSMYHLMIHPCNIGDFGQKPFYSTLSLWDTYRAAHPLMTIITPEIVADVANSMLSYYDGQGFLPMWTVSGTDNYGMIGNHSIPVIADAYLKGFKGIEAEALYQAMKKTVTVNHIKCDWEAYDSCGYFPYDVTTVESVSRTLECCYDDWCIAQMAKALGHYGDTAFFLKRSRYWKNLLDPGYKLMRARDSRGNWEEPFDPLLVGHWKTGGAFTEANSWQYTFHVQHDPQGLMEAMGGREAFVGKLDSLFNMKTELHGDLAVDVTGMRGQYAHGNEPSHHVIYLYSLAGEQNKAADLIREVWTEQYNDGPAGLSGNDDCGQMSAWYIFSSLGFYPVNPCGGEYVLGAPQLPEMTIHLGNGNTFKVTAEGLTEGKRHVAAVILNGKVLNGCTIRHEDIMKGGNLRFKMCER